MKKSLRIDKRAFKELKRLPAEVYAKFAALFEILEEEGKLEVPFARKLQGQERLFEMRVKFRGQWRAIYAYLTGDIIVVLSVFQKKTRKTSIKQLVKARNRLQLYITKGGEQ